MSTAVLVFSFIVLAFSENTFAQSVKEITLRQHYPWENLVDIDYTIEGMGDSNGVYIRFDIEDRASGKVYTEVPLEGEAPVENGRHRVLWDPLKAGLLESCQSLRSGELFCRARLYRDDPQRYLIIDLSAGKDAASYPVSYSPALPYEGVDNTYKTTRLIMRKIDPGTFTMGMSSQAIGYRADADMRPHPVTLTQPFYIGLFEVTQGQWERVTGAHPSRDKNKKDTVRGANRPVHTLSFDMIRGNDLGRRWPASSEVDPDSFIGKLREKTGLEWLDLPTEAQWEYAGRAGTTNTLNNGKELTDDTYYCPNAAEVGRYGRNQKDEKGEFTTITATVGSYRPNNWGLYDFHGNVWEFCLDYWSAPDNTPSAETDPKGPVNPSDSRNLRVRRSSGPEYNTFRMKIGDRHGTLSDWDAGLRLSGTLGTGNGTNRREILSEQESPSFTLEVQQVGSIRYVRPSTPLPLTYSEGWSTATDKRLSILRGEETLFTAEGGEGNFEWTTPSEEGKVTLTYTAEGVGRSVDLYVRASTDPATLSTSEADPVGVTVERGARAVLRNPGHSETITYSDRWDGTPGGHVEVMCGDEFLFTGEGEGSFGWEPGVIGINTLSHTDGERTITGRIFVMREILSGVPYRFRLETGEGDNTPPLSWEVDPQGGELPEGITLTREGELQGRTVQKGIFSFTALITPKDGKKFAKTYPLRVTDGGTLMILK